jgi:outer membrane autotransporter protein
MTHGNSADGLRAIQAGSVFATDTEVVTEGAGANGLHARDPGSLIQIDPSTVTTSGANANGAVAEAGGKIVGLETTVTSTGANASALYVAGDTGRVSEAEFAESSLTNSSGPTIGVGGTGKVTLTDSVAGGSGQWLKVGTIEDFPPLQAMDSGFLGLLAPEETDPPTDPFTAPAPLVVVPVDADNDLIGSTVHGSALTMAGSVSDVSLTGGSLWDLTGDSNVTHVLNDASQILFSPPSGVFKTLTVQTYHGQNGAVLGLNTFLQEDGSPSDLLVIDGGLGSPAMADGQTTLLITHAGGNGAVTVSDGIKVVDATNGATTTTDAFTLGNTVAAGPYTYNLFRGGLNPADNADDWFLRSTGAFRPETGTYSILPTLMLAYGRNILGNLHERVGEEEQLRLRTDLGDDDWNNGVWTRLIGAKATYQGVPVNPGETGPQFDANAFALQAGLDVYRAEDAEGRRQHVGIYGAAGTVNTTVSGPAPGTEQLSAMALGATWTGFGTEGQYLDAVAQATWYDMNAQSSGLNFAGDAFGVALSLEGGRPFHFDNGWVIEPQGQIVYQTIPNGHGADEGGPVTFEGVNSLAGRLGLRIARNGTYTNDAGEERAYTWWVRPNLWHQFLPDPTTVFQSDTGPIAFHSTIIDWWGQINVGGTAQIDDKTYIYANAAYDFDFTGVYSGFNGKIGLRMNW